MDVYPVYKEHLQLNKKKTNIPLKHKLMATRGEVGGTMCEIGDRDQGMHLWWALGIVWKCWITMYTWN